MGRPHWLSLGCLVACVAFPALARAEILDTTGSRSAGELSLAGELQAGLSPGTPLSLNVHEAIGLAGGVDLVAKQGFGLSAPHDVYLGAGLKWTLLHDKSNAPGLALWAGGHFLTGANVAGA